MIITRYLLALGLALSSPVLLQAQAPADTTHKYQNPSGQSALIKKPFFKSKGFRATIVPALLIGYGASTINGHSGLTAAISTITCNGHPIWKFRGCC
jgi:hypothetical protein